ncbi:gastrula zinc finger protein XlCGF66.1-like [Ranitomeya imitator]|uniref:gastrula zinc finger protein XlCGF66.1-like n=1 Tax=Ranitomeya imitator TaxID=111125 RepID=UPI0037E95E7A
MTPRMDEDRDETTRRLFHFALEIISLLSGEDYTIVRKTPGDGVTPIIHLQESGGRSPGPITEPPPHSLLHERNKKILELSNKMIELLSGEVPIRCQDVAVYLSMEEWEYLEGHQDRYQDVMMEELRPLTPRGPQTTKCHQPARHLQLSTSGGEDHNNDSWALLKKTKKHRATGAERHLRQIQSTRMCLHRWIQEEKSTREMSPSSVSPGLSGGESQHPGGSSG